MLCHWRGVLCILVLALGLLSAMAGEVEFSFTNTFDGSTQQAAAYIPAAAQQGTPLPLLVVAHYYGGTRFTARDLGYYSEMEQRGWLLVSPELHGVHEAGAASFAALPAQHDILDAIAYMQAHYAVDAARIYLAGRSMGGMMAEVMAAKHPDLFAAVVAGQGISDLRAWTEESPQFRMPVAKECGAYGKETAFAYTRRSAINYATNLQYVPLILWHGSNDTWVRPAQSERLHAAMGRYTRFLPPINWLVGAPHCAPNYQPAWVCDQLQYHRNSCEAGIGIRTRFYPRLSLVTDEAGPMFWLNLTPSTDDRFATVTAEVDADTLTITAANLAQLDVLMDNLPTGTRITRYAVKTTAPITIRLLRGDDVLFATVVTKRGHGDIR